MKTKLFAGSKRGTLFAAFLRAVSYIAIQGEIPMINSFNLFRREADTSFGWNLILVNDDYRIPRNYEVELTELSNGEKVDSRIYPQLQQMFDDARTEGLELFVREGYRTTQDQKNIMNERIQKYQDEGYSRWEAKERAEEYIESLR
ncbi:D-alanyl-D-alanine carboxypeptidase [Agathobacter rectalis ATCC 33656]|uniref:D-alanyl-D-alanine carboxypeptidase n=2 Tax=Agathobacter rectalis TaxID=39491 RepID=C4Z8K9_AGARV|nr:D-alanyl-D-alanine carboxypeptidase [Agathobacter rectalis ATCC 33656]